MQSQIIGVAESKDPVAVAFGKMIRTARIRRKLTQRQVSRDACYDSVSLSRAESGEITPGLGTAVKLMAAVGLLPAEMEGLARAAAPKLKIQKREIPAPDHRLDALCRITPQIFEALIALGEAVDLPLSLPSPSEISRLLSREVGDA